ncbi:MAG: hypothetical protein WC867_01805 [Candidatus Pacearchaeota archaeon]|jgi:hypothetical protein
MKQNITKILGYSLVLTGFILLVMHVIDYWSLILTLPGYLNILGLTSVAYGFFIAYKKNDPY